MESLRHKLVEKMDVYSADEQFIGEVKALYDEDFLVDRPFQRDFFVPYVAIEVIQGDSLLLRATLAEVEQSTWPTTAVRTPLQSEPSSLSSDVPSMEHGAG